MRSLPSPKTRFRLIHVTNVTLWLLLAQYSVFIVRDLKHKFHRHNRDRTDAPVATSWVTAVRVM